MNEFLNAWQAYMILKMYQAPAEPMGMVLEDELRNFVLGLIVAAGEEAGNGIMEQHHADCGFGYDAGIPDESQAVLEATEALWQSAFPEEYRRQYHPDMEEFLSDLDELSAYDMGIGDFGASDLPKRRWEIQASTREATGLQRVK